MQRPPGMRAALALALVAMLSACSTLASSSVASRSETSSAVAPAATAIESASPTACTSPPTVEYAAPGTTLTPLPLGSNISVTAKLRQGITIHFVGDCAVGGRLMINGTGPGQETTFTTVWQGLKTGNWSPTKPGTRTLLVAFACMGPMSCPLAIVAHIRVVTPAT